MGGAGRILRWTRTVGGVRALMQAGVFRYSGGAKGESTSPRRSTGHIFQIPPYILSRAFSVLHGPAREPRA